MNERSVLPAHGSEDQVEGVARRRARLPVTVLLPACWPLLGWSVQTRGGLVRDRLLTDPEVAPEYVGIAVAGGLVVLGIGMAVTLAVVQILAWAADGLLARLWGAAGSPRSVACRVAVGATVVAALAVDLLRGDPAAAFASGVPLLLAPAFALAGLVADRGAFAQATPTGRVTGGVLLLGTPVLTLISLGHPF
jgi:hypothetical protein